MEPKLRPSIASRRRAKTGAATHPPARRSDILYRASNLRASDHSGRPRYLTALDSRIAGAKAVEHRPAASQSTFDTHSLSRRFQRVSGVVPAR